MGKKNKKAGNNAKKVTEQVSVSLESSKPTTPEPHPYSLPDSTVTLDEIDEEAESSDSRRTNVEGENGLEDAAKSPERTEVIDGPAQGLDQGVTADEPELNNGDISTTSLVEPEIVSTEPHEVGSPEIPAETSNAEQISEAGIGEEEVEVDLAEIAIPSERPISPPSGLDQADPPSSANPPNDDPSKEEKAVQEDALSTSEVELETKSTAPPTLPVDQIEEGASGTSIASGPNEPHTSTPPLLRSPSFREHVTPNSSPRSPYPVPSPSASEAGPSRNLSASSHRSTTSRSPIPSRSELTSPMKSPQHVPFFAPKPTIPNSTPVIITGEDDPAEDDSTPFESIPLQSTPPSGLVPLPMSPGLHPGNGHDSATSPSRLSITIPPSRPLSVQLSRGDTPTTPEKNEAPRLHAPPAHPHPYPVPSSTSPPPPQEKRQSQPHAGPSGGLGVKGVSTFEKVISHTRPSWLPPKDRVEDETHYHQWEEMMSQARELEKEKRRVEEIKRVEREKRLAINTPKWEEMLDEKTFSADRIRKDPELRKIWFEGAPTYLRGKAWSLAIGNPLALSKDLYRSCVARSKKAIASGRFPPDILQRIETDLDKTLVNLHLFQHGSPLRADLHELICAWVVYRSDTALGYAPYINLLAALFLLSSPPASAFLSLVNLLSRPVLRAFYTETQDEIDAFYRVFENLQADMFPKIFANCKNLGLKVPESWFRSVLVEQVPFEAACRLWDQIVLDGDGYIFRSALANFGFLEPRLYFPDRDEIESILEGRNHATQAIVDREKERAKLRGETYLDELDGKLSVFGLNEQALFDWLAEDGWKEARFERLVTREMPD